jgi:hypothetical protein
VIQPPWGVSLATSAGCSFPPPDNSRALMHTIADELAEFILVALEGGVLFGE